MTTVQIGQIWKANRFPMTIEIIDGGSHGWRVRRDDGIFFVMPEFTLAQCWNLVEAEKNRVAPAGEKPRYARATHLAAAGWRHPMGTW